MHRRFDATVIGILLALGLAFSSCTCQRDLPEPPKKTSGLRKDAWSGLPTPARAQRRDLPDRELPQRRVIERDDAVELPTQEPRFAQEDAEIPEDFPEGVPVFKDAEVFGVQNLAAGAKNVLFHTDGDVAEVFQYYKDEMSSGGWDVKQQYQQSSQSFLSFERDGMVTNMTVATDSKTGKQVIAVMYYKQEPLPFEEF
jgi:hypothetical protein